LLVTITLNKVRNQVEYHSRGKRAYQHEAVRIDEQSLIGHLPRDPSPEQSACLSEQVEKVLGKLEPLHRRMFELRLQGYNLEEIAQATERSQRTVIRVLELVKDLLRGELPSTSH
jgi:DNA-directed RNA polymerase specialized sigma24 family protein